MASKLPKTPAPAPVPAKTATVPNEQNALPALPFGPTTWNRLFYTCVAAAALVGGGTILNGGVWTDAILRIFVTLLGSSILVIAFLTFVIVPLHVKHYQNLIAAQQAALQAAREKRAQEKEAEQIAADEADAALMNMNEPSFFPDLDGLLPESRSQRAQDDQAASLRRMAAGVR